MSLRDRFGRTIDYLRVSITDRCNLRCVYCLPASPSKLSPRSELLSDGELLRLAGVFAGLGVRRFRLTGGEPLLRADVAGLVAGLSRLPARPEVSLSTNGTRLAAMARPLRAGGLSRVNVSLDTLRPERFAQIARFGRIGDVLAGVDAALAAGLAPVKLNVVLARGMNDDEIAEFARLADERTLHVRFIELMPMGDAGFFSPSRVVPLEEAMAKAGPLEPLEPSKRPAGGGPARYFRRPGAAGTLGFISAMSCSFCADCNRMRLSARGMLHPCLDSCRGVDLGAALRDGADDSRLRELIFEALAGKPEGHAMRERAEASTPGPRTMCAIGG